MIRQACRVLAVSVSLALAAPALAAPPAAIPPSHVPPIVYSERTLPNGLKVYASLDRATPNVTVQVWYGVGSKTTPPGARASPTSSNT